MARIVAGDRCAEVQAVILDKDGTLTDFRHMWVRLWQSWADGIDRRVLAHTCGRLKADLGLMTRFIGVDPSTGWVDPDGPYAVAPDEELSRVTAYCVYAMGVSFPDACRIAEEARDEALGLLKDPDFIREIPGAREALERMKRAGLRLAVATLDTLAYTQKCLSEIGVLSLIDVVVSADDQVGLKPRPDMALLACKLLGVPPEKTVVVGDSTTDMEMARSAGIGLSVGVLSGVAPRGALEKVSDVVIGSVADLEFPEHA